MKIQHFAKNGQNFSVYGTQKPVHCTQNSVFVPWKIWANFVQNVEFSFKTKKKNLPHFKGSDGEIAFFKFHILLEVIFHSFHIIIS